MKRIIAIALLTAATAAAQDDTEDDAWDVNVAFGPTSPLEFETTEGTWMNLDISPTARKSSSTFSEIST